MKVKPLAWKKTATKPDRWEGTCALGLVYVVTAGQDGVWLWGRADCGWHGPEKSLETAKGFCDAEHSANLLAEIEA